MDKSIVEAARAARGMTRQQHASKAGGIGLATLDRSVGPGGPGVDEATARKICAAVNLRIENARITFGEISGPIHPRVDDLIGREDGLALLHGLLTTEGLRRAVILGMPGVGKTALAVEYIHKHRGEYRRIWWCPAASRADLQHSLAERGRSMNLVKQDQTDEQGAEDVILFLGRGDKQSILLVYDNVEDPQMLTGLYPPAGMPLIVTSRHSDWQKLPEPKLPEVPLDVLSSATSVAFLEAYACRKDTPGAAKLAEVLDGLPLALLHAAIFCRRTGKAFVDYAAEIQHRLDTKPGGERYTETVRATFEHAIDHIADNEDPERRCPDVRQLMDLLGYCSHDQIPRVLIDRAFPTESSRAGTALLRLQEYSLVRRQPFDDDPEAVIVHRLVQMVARELAANCGRCESAVDALANALLLFYLRYHRSPKHSGSEWRLLMRLISHATSWLNAAELNNVHSPASSILSHLVWKFLGEEAGEFNGAIPFLRYWAAATVASEHNNNDVKMWAIQELAKAEKVVGNHEHAVVLAQVYLDVVLKNYGSDHFHVVDGYLTLGDTLIGSGDHDAGLPALHKAEAESERIPSVQPIRRIDVLRSLARAAIDILNKPFLAVRYLKKAAKIQRKYLTSNSELRILLANQLAECFKYIGDFQNSVRLQVQVLKYYENLHGPDDVTVAISAQELAEILCEVGAERSDILRFYARAEEIFMTLREPHPLAMDLFHSRGTMNFLSKHLEEAYDDFHRAHQISEAAKGRNDPGTTRLKAMLEIIRMSQEIEAGGETDLALIKRRDDAISALPDGPLPSTPARIAAPSNLSLASLPEMLSDLKKSQTPEYPRSSASEQ